MKKNILFALLIVTFGCFMTIISCKKQNGSTIISETPVSNDNDILITKKIKQFVSEMNSNHKSFSEMSVYDAIWNLEAGLNYTYCNVSRTQEMTMIDSLLINVPIANGNMNSTSINEVWNQCVSKFESMKNETTFQPNHFVLADLIIKSNEDSNAQLKIVIEIAQTSQNTGSKVLTPFGSTDYWLAGCNLGKCNGYIGSGDAAQQIRSHVNADISYQSGSYFTNIETQYNVCALTYPIGGDGIPPLNYCDCGMWMQHVITPGYPTSNECLSPYEMNWHMNGTKLVMNTYTPSGPRPIGKSPISITAMFWNEQLLPVNVPYMEWHEAQISYGVYHFNSGN
jgi:hypothetical protein